MINVRQLADRHVQQNLSAMISQMRQNGMTPQQAYDLLMKDPQFVQSTNVAKQQYPNMSFVDIARENGFEIDKYFAGNLF